MEITLRPELQRRIETKVQSGEYETTEALVQEALHWYLSMEDDEGEIEGDKGRRQRGPGASRTR